MRRRPVCESGTAAGAGRGEVGCCAAHNAHFLTIFGRVEEALSIAFTSTIINRRAIARLTSVREFSELER